MTVSEDSTQPSADANSTPRRRPWRIRCIAVLFSLALLASLEGILYVTGVAEPSAIDDPFVGFTAIHPLFVLTKDGQRYHTAPQRRSFFAVDAFTREKAGNARRIFVVGGSTVQGRPFSIPTSFTHFLELALNATQPEMTWEVVNCGGISYASYRLVAIVRECLTHQPDLLVICTGHNEFLEDVSYPSHRRTLPGVPQAFGVLQRLRTFRLLHSVVQGGSVAPQPDPERPMLADEADALLDHQGGLQAYQRDPEHAAAVAEHYRSNVTRMVQLARAADVPVLLIQPPWNLTDCPPFKSQFSEGITEEQQQSVLTLLQEASSASRTDLNTAVTLLERALAIDPAYALSWYQLGEVLLTMARIDEARHAFQQAVDHDVCPLRMTTSLRTELAAVADSLDVPLLDAQALMAQESDHGLVGGLRLVDHIHPSFRGHQDLAAEILMWMDAESLTRPLPADWQATCQDFWARSIQGLDDIYFLRGQRALKDLQGWAAGRAQGPPLRRHLNRSD